MPILANAKYELYAQALAAGETADSAYVSAGFARNRGNTLRLKNNPEIKARVAELLGNAAERVEITKARVLEELGRIGFSDLRKLFTPAGSLKRIEDMDDDTAAAISSIKVVTRRVPGGEEAEVEHVAEVKSWDKRAALVDIGKHLGMFKEEPAPPAPPAPALTVTDPELARLIVFQLTKASKEA